MSLDLSDRLDKRIKTIYPPDWFFDVITKPITLSTHHFVFEGIQRDFNDYWSNDTKKYWKSKEAHWNKLLEFITEYTELYGNLITEEYGVGVKNSRIRCIIETKQEFKGFSLEHIIQFLEGLGKLANLMYGAETFTLPGNHVLERRDDYPLESSYVSALESIVWNVATFTQTGNFTDLVTRLKQLEKEGK